MVDITYLDGTERRKLLAKWLPICLRFLHFWATMFAFALVTPSQYTNYSDKQLTVLEKAFWSCGFSIVALILLLMSDKVLDFILLKFGSSNPIGQVIERTTTEKTVTTPSNPVASSDLNAQNVTVTGENVNVGMGNN